MIAGMATTTVMARGQQHQRASPQPERRHIGGHVAGQTVHQRVQGAHGQHQGADQHEQVEPQGEDVVGQREQRRRHLGILERRSPNPFPTAAMPDSPMTKVRGMAMATAVHRVRLSDRWLSMVYTRCHMPGWKALGRHDPDDENDGEKIAAGGREGQQAGIAGIAPNVGLPSHHDRRHDDQQQLPPE